MGESCWKQSVRAEVEQSIILRWVLRGGLELWGWSPKFHCLQRAGSQQWAERAP